MKRQVMVCFFLFCCGFLLSCASVTTVRVTNDKNLVDYKTDIYIDGSYKGKGEAEHSNLNLFRVFSPINVMLKKENCSVKKLLEPKHLNTGKFVGGLALAGLISVAAVMKFVPTALSAGLTIGTLYSAPIVAAFYSFDYKPVYNYHSYSPEFQCGT